MFVLEKSGLRELSLALKASPHQTHFVIPGIDQSGADEITNFLTDSKRNLHPPTYDEHYRRIAITIPKGEVRENLIKALEEIGISMGLENYQGARR